MKRCFLELNSRQKKKKTNKMESDEDSEESEGSQISSRESSTSPVDLEIDEDLDDSDMAQKKEWSIEEIQKLINFYKENAIWWDTKCGEYRNMDKKQIVLQKIAAKFSCTLDEVQRKLQNLRNQVEAQCA
ncbi:hypothetical protein RN001_003484 [Aquatica leii]|uniref:MADF domain-containing protein n=1 Tax=Aquatica leii TaxID=1421715 RepID=A0AAN7PIN0_9COLE|nr:hypothetical protein RN001_003484 [Aquatica leii]